MYNYNYAYSENKYFCLFALNQWFPWVIWWPLILVLWDTIDNNPIIILWRCLRCDRHLLYLHFAQCCFVSPSIHNLFNSSHVEQFTYSIIILALLSICCSSTANFLRWGAGTASIVWDVDLKHAVMILCIWICNCFPNTGFAFLIAAISHTLPFLWPGLYSAFLTDRQSVRCYFATVVVYHQIVIAYVLRFFC